jgi:predicted amidohydrolase
MKVAAIQFAPVFKDIVANVNTMEGLVAEAAKGGAELVVLPEMCTAGYSFMYASEAKTFCEGRLSTSNPSIKAMVEASNSLGVAIAWGLIEKGDESGETLYNSQALCLPGQGLVATYRKRNRYGNDYLWAAPGDVSPTIVTYKGRKVGMLICRDIKDSNDVNDDLYEPGDADIIAFSANFGNGPFPANAWMRFVSQNKTALVVSNRYGQEENNNFGQGGIGVIHPDGKIDHDGLKWSAPCIVHSTV